MTTFIALMPTKCHSKTRYPSYAGLFTKYVYIFVFFSSSPSEILSFESKCCFSPTGISGGISESLLKQLRSSSSLVGSPIETGLAFPSSLGLSSGSPTSFTNSAIKKHIPPNGTNMMNIPRIPSALNQSCSASDSYICVHHNCQLLRGQRR